MKRLSLYGLAFCCIILGSCSGNNSTSPPPPTADQIIAEGWQKYAAGQYQEALNKFNEALGMDAGKVDAYNGAGWANAHLNALSASVTSFLHGFSRDTTDLEIKAGLALVFHAQKNYFASIERALPVLQANIHWTFSRDAAINYSDLRILLAEDYFGLANYPESKNQVLQVEPGFSADVSTIEGQTALGQEIEALRAIY